MSDSVHQKAIAAAPSGDARTELTSDHLAVEKPHPLGGIQRIYRFANDFGLSLVNSPMLHAYCFAWEAAVLKGVTANGNFDGLTYDTPLTNDVEIFMTAAEANKFIRRAANHFGRAAIAKATSTERA